MVYGGNIKKYRDIAKRRRVEALENIPEPLEYYWIFWQIFNDLHRSRTAGFSPNPISISEVLVYSEFRGLDEVETMFCLRIIQSLDSAFFEWVEKRSKKKGG